MALLSDVDVTFFSSVVVLIAKGQFLDCATIVSCERYVPHLRLCNVPHQGRSANTPQVSGVFP